MPSQASSKISRKARKKNQPFETDPKVEKVIALLDRDVNLVAKSAFHMFKKITERLDIVKWSH